jgi:putative tricarboxylic transport membrane protein
MTLRLRAPDLWAGLALMALAAAYFFAATGIQRSLLSDEVGAAGLPKVLAVFLGFAGALLAARSQWIAPKASLRLTARAAGILVLIAAYILVLPVAGYPLTIFALVACVALLAGAPPTLGLALTAIAAGLGFWLIFARLLGISVPVGPFSGWI